MLRLALRHLAELASLILFVAMIGLWSAAAGAMPPV
jgi:hypothetical protein